MKTLRALYQECAGRVGSVDAEILIQEAFERLTKQPLSRLDLFSEISSPQGLVELTFQWIKEREEGKLLQHITGIQVFGKHRYLVSPHVLIPRQETEILLEAVREYLKKTGVTRGFELGIGSGILSIELLSEFTDLKMVASEVSEKAKEIALKNAVQILGNQSDRLTILSVKDPRIGAEVFQGIQAAFFISNPPYLVQSSEEVDEDVQAQEPNLALFPRDSNVNYFYEDIAASARGLLFPDGKVFLEIPHERALLIREIFEARGWEVTLILDLTGRPRVLIGS